MLYSMLTGEPIVLNDVTEKQYYFQVPFAQSVCHDTKNLAHVHLILNNFLFLCLVLPCLWYSQSHIVGIVYLSLHYVLFFGPYMVYQHDHVHIKIFKNKYMGNFIALFVVGQCHGQPYGTYYINHVIMHHKGANAWGKDFSSTERYDRSSIVHFWLYWLRHYMPVTFLYDMVLTCFQYRRYKIGTAYLVWTLFWYATAYYLLHTRFYVATLYTLVLPICITSLAGAFGSMMQHCFIHPTLPRKWYSYDIINSRCNAIGFNTGYHNTHHTMVDLHWEEYPDGFRKLVPVYHRDKVLIMHTLDNVAIMLLIYAKQYKKLATYMVSTEPGGHSLQHCIEVLKKHLAPVYC